MMDLDLDYNYTIIRKFTQNNLGKFFFTFICAFTQFVLGFASYYLTFENDVVFAIFIPAGTSFLFVTHGYKDSKLSGRLAVLGTFIGAFSESVINLIFNFGIPILLSMSVVFFIAIGNAMQPLLAFIIIDKSIKNEIIFTRFKHVAFFLIGPTISCAIAALIGVLSLNIAKITPWSITLVNLFTWWIADLTGVLIIAPLGLIWYLPHTRSKLKTNIEKVRFHISTVLYFISLASYFFIISTPIIPGGAKISASYLIIPLIIWAVFLFSGRMLFLLHLINALTFVIITIQKHSPFYQLSIANSLIQIQFFIIIISVITLVLFTLRMELNISLHKLKKYSSKLENEVKVLSGLLPICAHCKKIRDDSNNHEWKILEDYITGHSEAMFTHGLCPDCMEKYYK
jgi:integral membrane sensor domain MASE1